MHRLVQSAVALVLCVSSWQATAGPDPRYAIVPVVTGNFFIYAARGINNQGDVIGTIYVDDAGNELRGFVHSGGVTTILGTLGGLSSNPYGLNDRGQIVGESQTADGIYHSTLFNGSSPINLTPGLSRPSGATAINDGGVIVGVVPCDCGDFHAARYAGGDINDLGTLGGPASDTSGINDAGQIVGFTTSPGPYAPRAYLYEHGVMTDIGTLGGDWADASAINRAGQIAGQSQVAGPGDHFHAFLYTHGMMTDLGALDGHDTTALALNNVGQVVGAWSAGVFALNGFLWENGVMFDLNGLVDPALGWTIHDARGINDAGQIVVNGCNEGLGVCGVLRLDPNLSPVPEPAAFGMWLAALGLAGMRLGRRRMLSCFPRMHQRCYPGLGKL